MRFKNEDLADEAGLNRCAKLVRYASSMGINYFDIAPEYANEQEEIFFLKAFKKMPNGFYIASKSKISSEKSSEEVFLRIKKSIQILAVPKIHFYNMWSIMSYNHYLQVIKNGGPYEGALRAKKEGLIDHIGFSAHCPPDDIIRIISEGLFKGVTISFNILNFSKMEPVLEVASTYGIGVVTMNSLGGGIIPENRQFFQSMCHSDDDDVLICALQFNGSYPQISSVLSGMKSKDEIDENIKAFFDCSKDKNASQMIFKPLSFPDELCTGCNYCLSCPENIPIFDYIQVYNYTFFPDAELMGMKNELLDSQKRHVNNFFHHLRVHHGIIPEIIDNPCISCGGCEGVCTQNLPINTRLEEIYSWAQKHQYSKKNLHNKFENLFHIDNKKTIGLYPAGAYTESIISFYLSESGSPSFSLYVFDGNERLWGQDLCGYSVCSPDDIISMGIERVIITNFRYQNDIYKKLQYLEDRGIEVLFFHEVDDIYWF